MILNIKQEKVNTYGYIPDPFVQIQQWQQVQ